MTLLQPGEFRVSDYRKDIPDRVVKLVLKRYNRDHRPPLSERPYDTEAGDFIPPQLDPEHIDLIPIAVHGKRTFGREPGAEKTVTTAGSDAGERRRVRDIRTTQAIHEATLASKAGDYRRAADILATAPKKSRVKNMVRKRKIPSRPFSKGRSFQRRGTQ